MEPLEHRVRESVLHAVPKLRSRESEIGDATSLFDLGIDSLDHAKILMAVEDSFGIEIDDEDINGLQSIGDLSHYCAQRMRSQP
jgi:acyl carrier protein